MADTKKTGGAPEEKVQIIKLHHLRPAPGSKKAKTRVGRGEGSKGKTSGRGTKGTKARRQVRPGFEGGQMPLHMRLPKLRGFKNPNRVEYQPVNVGRIAELFPEGGTVTVEELVARGAVRPRHLVKVLGSGDVDVKLDVVADAWSGSAKEKVGAPRLHRQPPSTAVGHLQLLSDTFKHFQPPIVSPLRRRDRYPVATGQRPGNSSARQGRVFGGIRWCSSGAAAPAPGMGGMAS